MPGDEVRNKFGPNPTANKDIFQKPKLGGGGGGGTPKRKAEPVAEPEEDLVPEQAVPPKPQEPAVKLTNPKWAVETAHFGDTVAFSIDVDLPESLKDITRVIVTAFSLPAKKKKEQVKARDFYVKDGKVQGEFELVRPENQDGKEVESCPYYFTAKHRDSKELEGPHLPVQDKPKGNDELILELKSSEELKTGGFVFHLKSKDGTVDQKIETKSGQEKEGTLTLKFTKLDPKLEYALDLLNADGKVAESIFPNTQFGKWTEGSK